MTGPDRLAEMTTVEAAGAAARGTVVLIPAGALEQHGPAMALGTDLVRAEAVVAEVATNLPGRVVVGPSIPVGVSPHHLRFPGTVTLTTGTFAALVREYVTSLHRHGWTRFLVVTGHGGNNAALTTVAQDLLVSHPDVQFAWSPLTALAGDAVAALRPSAVHGHSGEAETAQMLYLAPHLVHTDRLEPGTTTPDQLDDVSRVARHHAQPTLTLPYDRLSPNGVLGDPRRATADDGAAIVKAVVGRITAFLEDWPAS
ncbi:creatininase family protein [Myceligenerans salitolerans]|uniref:Creatininase family protein n=2 Tax=Myceligenerans salitolerans TaxID=1230528 RepID=A0ABS3IA58_9MICO|nr:creatininase family protein [Myceligenerans salitolerans]